MRGTRNLGVALLVAVLALIGALSWTDHVFARRDARQAQLDQALTMAIHSSVTADAGGQPSVGDVVAVRRLLAAGANPNAREGVGPPRPWVRQILDRLLRHTPPPGDAGVAVLTQAATDGNAAIVSDLLAKGADPNALAQGGPAPMTALMCAASLGQPAAMRVLIEAGADVNARRGKDSVDSIYQTALSCAVEGDAPDQTIPLLLAHGANVNAVLDGGGHTELMNAVNWQKPAAVGALLAGHPNLGARSVDGTALAMARRGQSKHIVTLLKQAGAAQ